MHLRGKVVHGRGYGRKIGYPTANIAAKDILSQQPDLPHGVYAGLIERIATGETYLAGIVLYEEEGRRKSPRLEAYLIDYDGGDLYGEELGFTFSSCLRPYQRYDSEEALKMAIASDVEKIRELFAKPS